MPKLPSEKVAVLATIDPDAYSAITAYTLTSDWADMTKYPEALAVIMVGTIATSGTVDAKLQQASSSTGAGAKDITGKSITQLTQAGTDSDKQALINVREDELDVANSFTHVRLAVKNATGAADFGAVLLGLSPTHGVANDNDLSTVDEIV
jgi:ethanolamine ammonia-lyase small subunit